MLADPIYVGYRSYHPDVETVNRAKQQLKENNIDFNKLVEWPEDRCLPEESSTENDEGNGK
jgi:hypothetical protein